MYHRNSFVRGASTDVFTTWGGGQKLSEGCCCEETSESDRLDLQTKKMAVSWTQKNTDPDPRKKSFFDNRPGQNNIRSLICVNVHKQADEQWNKQWNYTPIHASGMIILPQKLNPSKSLRCMREWGRGTCGGNRTGHQREWRRSARYTPVSQCDKKLFFFRCTGDKILYCIGIVQNYLWHVEHVGLRCNLR